MRNLKLFALLIIVLSGCSRKHSIQSSGSAYRWEIYDYDTRMVYEKQTKKLQFANQQPIHIEVVRKKREVDNIGNVNDSIYTIVRDISAFTECLLSISKPGSDGSMIYKMEFTVEIKNGPKKGQIEKTYLYYTEGKIDNGRFMLREDPDNAPNIKVSLDGKKTEFASVSTPGQYLMYSYLSVSDGQTGKGVNNSLPGRH